jgi:pimeloyl-ACP methyl ester carboxylesterase
MKETAVAFGSSSRLAGILTDPDTPDASRPAFLFMNAGVTHRVGPNRLYVRLARALAREGFASLRFDFSGLGDSAARGDELPPAKSVVAEAREAMDLLRKERGIDRFVPIGICSGGTVAFMTAREDPRVVGAVVINAQGHLHGTDPELSEHLHSRTMARHSWRIAFFSSFRSKNWIKAVTGELDPRRILRMMIGFPLAMILRRRRQQREREQSPIGEALDPAAALREVLARDVHLFHLYCEADEGLDYFHVALGDRAREIASERRGRFEIISGANHVFTLIWSQDDLVARTTDWARVSFPPGGSGTALD